MATLQDLKNLKKKQEDIKSKWTTFWQKAKEFWAWVIRAGEQLPEVAGNIGSLAIKWLWKLSEVAWNVAWVSPEQNIFVQQAKKMAPKVQQTWKAITEAWMTRPIAFGNKPRLELSEEQKNIRKVWWVTALTTPLPLVWWWVVKWTWLLPTIGRWALMWAEWTAWYTVAKEWRLPTTPELATGTIWWAIAWPLLEKVAIPAIAKTAEKAIKYWKAWYKWWLSWLWKSVWRDVSKIWQWPTAWIKQSLTRNIPESIVKRDLWFTPTERKKIESILWQTESQYILKKWLAWKWKEELAWIFGKQANDMYQWIGTKLKNVQAPAIQSKYATEALQDMLDQLTSSPKLQRAYSKDIEWIQTMLDKWAYNLDELNNIRRAFDKVNTWMYTAQWKARSWIENAVDVDIRNWISKQLQEESKKYWIDIKEMNKELRAWIELKDALLRRLSQEERNNFIWLQDLWVSAILSWWNPLTAMATIWAKKYWEKMAPTLAQKLFNINKKPYVSSRMTRGNPVSGGSKSSKLGLSNNTRNTMVKPPVKQVKEKPVLALPQGKIVTPQTVEKWVIQESKKWLEKTKFGMNKSNPEAYNYKLSKQIISDTDKVDELKQLKLDIKDLWLAREKDLLQEIDAKILWLDEINKIENISTTLKKEYWEDLIRSFNKLYWNEKKIIIWKSWDKYSKVEFLKTPQAKDFSLSAQEYINKNPWSWANSVQDLYDKLKLDIFKSSNKTWWKYGKSWFINPWAILNDFKKAWKSIKNVLTSRNPNKPYSNKRASIWVWDNPIVNKQTGETLNQAIEKLRKNNWSEKDIQKFKNDVLKWSNKTIKKSDFETGILTSLNPTWWLLVDYNPWKINKLKLWKNITTLDKTAWKNPNDIVIIYRWAPKSQKSIVPWDFITTNYDLAKSYAWEW